MLLTGDTQGYVNIYDISAYCIADVANPQGENRPPVLATWRAHVQGINAIRFAAERAVLTASADCSVRVWSASGDYVGTFGGADSQWLLSLPTTMSVEEARAQAQTGSEAETREAGGDVAESRGEDMLEPNGGKGFKGRVVLVLNISPCPLQRRC